MPAAIPRRIVCDYGRRVAALHRVYNSMRDPDTEVAMRAHTRSDELNREIAQMQRAYPGIHEAYDPPYHGDDEYVAEEKA